ncbi:hypothetical protein C121_97 [Stenotrophomonas phage C121]|uniref:hypothetical protein n=1 Tax=Stenotrophomonas phage C121 TaxID=2914029 RepID=UPI0023295A38|nr:hypothetical protein PP752_gp97 [Stenotrophomonas phage C121]UKL14830.1 hypothetical protein C121_97 [Stenotrophomonas phage C121]
MNDRYHSPVEMTYGDWLKGAGKTSESDVSRFPADTPGVAWKYKELPKGVVEGTKLEELSLWVTEKRIVK